MPLMNYGGNKRIKHTIWVGEPPKDSGTENWDPEKHMRDYQQMSRNMNPATMHPDLAEQLGIPTYRQTGDVGDFYSRRGHLLVEAWRYNPDELRRQEAEMEALSNGIKYIGRIFRQLIRRK